MGLERVLVCSWGGGGRLVRYVVLILSVHIASHTLACVAEWGVAGVVVGADL